MTVIKVDTAKIGRLGGLRRAENMTAKQLSEQGRKAVNARWEKWRLEHPEKAAAKNVVGKVARKGSKRATKTRAKGKK